ncbi:MAG: ribosomal protection-like ABC-F family protein [Longibaculum sp.]
MSFIQVKNLSFAYPGSYEDIFKDISFVFDTHFKTALIGRNGIGKTTLLRLFMHQYEYQGEINIQEECQYFPYHVQNDQLYTIDICFEIEPQLLQWQLEKELRLLDVDPQDVFYRSFCTLSKGEQTKVLLAVLFLKPHSYLLIDEPTNHLDQQSRQIVAQYLKKQKGFLLVSHDRFFIDACCDHVIAINPTSIDVVSGNFSSWYDNKEKKDTLELKQNEKLKKDIVKLENSRRQKAKWSDQVEKSKIGAADKGHVGHMAAKMMKRSKSIEKRKNKSIEQKKGLLKDIEEYDDLKLSPLSYFQSPFLRFSHFSLGYQNKLLFHDVSLSIESHDRILLKGKNGCGKSSLIAFIMGANIDYQGDFSIGSRLKISYVPQDCSYLKGNLDDYIKDYQVDETLVKTILRKLGFSRIQFEKTLNQYSEGQKKKVMLAISLATSAHLYIWDEPLNYIDIFSRMQLEKLILKYQPTLLFVEHDGYFQQTIATKVIDFDELI